MAARHQLEGTACQRKRWPVLLSPKEPRASLAEATGRHSQVRIVPLGRDGEPGQLRQIRNHLGGARLQVEHPRDGRCSFRHAVEVPPRRSFLRGAAIKPAEVPNPDGCLLGLVEEFTERPSHGCEPGTRGLVAPTAGNEDGVAPVSTIHSVRIGVPVV